MFLARWRAKRANRTLIDQIHGEIVAASREPLLFRDLGVPDDLDGRFEMLALHGGLTLRRLAMFGADSAALSQDVVDRLFEGFEDALRELSISDSGVSKRMKSMAASFLGRGKAYGEALDAADPFLLASALSRNAYRAGENAVPEAARLAERVIDQAAALSGIALETFRTGRFRFPKPSGGAP